MKFYLTLLRHEGKRLASDRLHTVDRLVSTQLSATNGTRHLLATCCFGGETVAMLWDPVLARIGNEDITLRGVEQSTEAAVVQEWRLRPSCVDPWAHKPQKQS